MYQYTRKKKITHQHDMTATKSARIELVASDWLYCMHVSKKMTKKHN